MVKRQCLFLCTSALILLQAGSAWGGIAPPPVDPCPGCPTGGDPPQCNTVADCDALGACYTISCTNGDCVYTNDCNDGVACTRDACLGDVCVFSPSNKSCNDNNKCTTDSCDVVNGCQFVPKDCTNTE